MIDTILGLGSITNIAQYLGSFCSTFMLLESGSFLTRRSPSTGQLDIGEVDSCCPHWRTHDDFETPKTESVQSLGLVEGAAGPTDLVYELIRLHVIVQQELTQPGVVIDLASGTNNNIFGARGFLMTLVSHPRLFSMTSSVTTSSAQAPSHSRWTRNKWK